MRMSNMGIMAVFPAMIQVHWLRPILIFFIIGLITFY